MSWRRAGSRPRSKSALARSNVSSSIGSEEGIPEHAELREDVTTGLQAGRGELAAGKLLLATHGAGRIGAQPTHLGFGNIAVREGVG